MIRKYSIMIRYFSNTAQYKDFNTKSKHIATTNLSEIPNKQTKAISPTIKATHTHFNAYKVFTYKSYYFTYKIVPPFTIDVMHPLLFLLIIILA